VAYDQFPKLMPGCTEIVRKRRCPEPRISVADEAQKLFEASLAWANAHCGVKMPSPYLSYAGSRRSGQALLTYDFATNDLAALVSTFPKNN
jgi:hypothetical protein